MVAIVPEKQDDCCVDYDPNEKRYPYGTSLTLEDEIAEAVGFDALAAGDVVEVRAKAFIKRTRSVDEAEAGEADESRKSIDIQLTDIELVPESPDRASQLYPGDSE